MKNVNTTKNVKNALSYLALEAKKEGFSDIAICIETAIIDIQTWQEGHRLEKVTLIELNDFLIDMQNWIMDVLLVDWITHRKHMKEMNTDFVSVREWEPIETKIHEHSV